MHTVSDHLEFGQYTPRTISPPGDTLMDVLTEKMLSELWLSEATGISEHEIREIVSGRMEISERVAKMFEKALRIPAGFWMARERHYRNSLKEELA